jgi:hypothetical protein
MVSKVKREKRVYQALDFQERPAQTECQDFPVQLDQKVTKDLTRLRALNAETVKKVTRVCQACLVSEVQRASQAIQVSWE